VVHVSGRALYVCGGAAVDVVYVTLDRRYCVGGEECEEYLADVEGWEGEIGGVEGAAAGIVGKGGGGCDGEVGVAEKCGGVGGE